LNTSVEYRTVLK